MTTIPIVYLDSQDYLNFSTGMGQSEVRAVFDYLVKKREMGKIRIAFSAAIIFEVIRHAEPQFMDNRAERGKVIKDLCGTDVFPYWTDLQEEGAVYNDGCWMPRDAFESVSIRKIKAIFEKNIFDAVNTSSANRNARRSLRNPRAIEKLLREKGFEFGRKSSDFGTIPVPDSFIKGHYFERYLAGKISETVVSRALIRWFNDPEEFARLYYGYGKRNDAITEFFGGMESKFDEMKKLSASFRFTISEAKSVLSLGRKTLFELGVSKKAARASTRISIPNLGEMEFDLTKLNALFGEKRTAHFLRYGRALAIGEVLPQLQDAGDLMHLVYAYDCTFFRCDVRMANVMASVPDLKGKLVARLSDLVPLIDEAIGGGSLRQV
jgi:hypothetical protein